MIIRSPRNEGDAFFPGPMAVGVKGDAGPFRHFFFGNGFQATSQRSHQHSNVPRSTMTKGKFVSARSPKPTGESPVLPGMTNHAFA